MVLREGLHDLLRGARQRRCGLHHGLRAEVAAFSDGPFIVLSEQDGADEGG